MADILNIQPLQVLDKANGGKLFFSYATTELYVLLTLLSHLLCFTYIIIQNVGLNNCFFYEFERII